MTRFSTVLVFGFLFFVACTDAPRTERPEEEAPVSRQLVPFGVVGGTESGCDANNIHALGEACDNGADVGCTETGTGPGSTCRVDDHWRCVKPLGNAPSSCGPDCGDGFAFSAQGEVCDDGNANSGDGCVKGGGIPPVCQIESGWSCTVTAQNTSICKTTCGDALAVGPEGCDDGVANSDFAPNACRTDCTVARCGDAVEDSVNNLGANEVCDDGAFNGLPGMCNSSCTGMLPELATAQALSLSPAPAGTFGLFLTDSFLVSMCFDLPVADFDIRDNWLRDQGLIAGRIIRPTTDIIVRHPVLLLDDGASSFDGESMFATTIEFTEPLFGDFLVPAGAPVLVSVRGGSAPGCPCPSLVSQFREGCVREPIDIGGNPVCGDSYEAVGDSIGLAGITCPEWQPADAVSWTLPGDVPVGSAEPTSINAMCGQQCLTAGGSNCAQPPSVEPPPSLIGCSLSDLDVAPVCTIMAGGPLGACQGYCTQHPDASCGTLDGATGPPGADRWDECDIALGPEGLECGDAFENDGVANDQMSLATLWQICHANPIGDLACLDFDPPGHDDDIEMLVCNPVVDGGRNCSACTDAAGRGCLPIIDVPASFPQPPQGVSLCTNCGSNTNGSGNQRVSNRGGSRLGNPKLKQQMVSDPVALGSGELFHTVEDVAFPARGVSFSFMRTYRSGGLRSGSLGPGWTHNYEERIVPVGDLFNRAGMPDYCVSGLPEISCLLRTDEAGGLSLWILDPETRTFLPPPGEAGSIAVRMTAAAESQHVRDITNLPAIDGLVFEHRAAGGVLRTYDVGGPLLTITDEMGFGLALEYRTKTEAEMRAEGAWSNVEVVHLQGEPQASLEAAHAHGDRLNRLNAMELVEIRDSYGRVFNFNYETHLLSQGTESPRRRRLSEIKFRAQTLVRFDFDDLDATQDTYLTNVERLGLTTSLPATTSTTVSYEYAHDLFLPGELFHRDAGGGYASVLATELSGTIDLFDDTRFGCASAGAVPDVRPTSGDPCAVSYPSGPYPGVDPASDFMWLTLKRAVADNIVRIAVDGEIELETRYEVSPFKINFDHVIEQRYGQVPSPLPTPENIVEGDSSVHRWHTNLPRSLLEYLPGNTEPPGFTLADTTHGPLEDPDDAVVIPALCNFPDLEDVPAFFPQVPVGPRVDLTTPTSTPSLKRTAATCEQLAGRWTGRLDAAGLSVSFHDDPLVTRGNRAWDLNLICEWVKETDRRGAAHWHGLNFEGTELVGLHPSPAAPTLLAATSRLVNADGFLVKETRPDGAIAEIEYEPPSRFGRHLPTKLTERAGTASHLIAAVTESLNGTSTSLSERETRFFWEPLFQQPLRIERPDLSREHFRYDWQQLGASTAEARALLAGANDHGIAVTPSNFLTVDIDGDGDRGGESSAQEVLRFIEDAALGGGVINDVGTRTTRDETGRMTDTWAITNADNAATDFNRTSFTYYENLPKAEAGDLSVANCKKPCGPLATLTRHRTSTATSADHLDVTFMAYDALGGVRLSRENGDAATNTVILRDGLGRVFEEQHPFKLVLREFDGQGRAVVETHNGNDGKTIVTRFAWGLADTALGSCAELVGGACNDFQAYALGLFRAVRAGTALPSLPAALTQADFTVGVVDVEDAPTHVYGPFGLETQRTLSLAGLVTNEKIEAGSDQHHRLVYDVEGRVLSHSTGTSTTDVLRTLWRYDRFGRATDIQTRMPLANTTVSTSVGSLERAGYDVMDRVVRASTLGDTGLGTRRVLRTLRHELNALGLPLFSHYGSASSLPSTVPAKSSSGASATDAFATESFRYDPALRLTRVDREGILTPWTAGYDHFGATALTGPAIKKRSIAHIPRTRTTTTDTSWRPEGAGAVTTGVNTLVERDVRGLIERVTATDATAGVKQQSEFEYDGLGRLERQVDPTGRTVVTTWGPLSRPSKIDESGTDGLARTTVLNHDARGRVLSSDPSDAPATEYDYDVAGNLIFEQSGDISTSWDRDSVGRMEDRIRGVRGNERAFRWTYDANQSSPSSLLVDGTAAKSWLRDGLDRPIVAIDKNLVLDADASNSPTLPSSRGTLTTSVRYDVLGRVVADETLGKFPSSSPTAPNSEVLLSESARSHGTAFLGPNTVTFLSGERLNKTYGDNGDVVGLGRQGINGAQLDIALSYQGRQWVRATLPNSLRVTKERDGVGNVRSSSFQIGTTTTFSEDVIRGPTGRVVGAHTTTTFLGKRLLSHRYDGLARLKQTSVDLNTAMTVSAFRGLFDDAATSEAFNPVTASDAIAVHARGEADTLTSSTSDEQGRKFSALYDGLEAGVPPTKINGRSIDRDEQDRIEADGTLSYVFDALDRLVLVTRAGSDELRLTYDGFGRRRLERRREGVTGTVINDVVLEYDGGNVVEERLVGGAVLMGTLHAPELDAPLLVTTGPLEVVSWFGLGTAVRGDVTHAVDATGSVVEEQLLDAFGERELSTGGTVCVEGKEGGSTSLPMQTCKPKVLNLFGISGARQHPRTKLVDLRNRVYATHLRGFLSKDPLGNIDSDGLWNYVAGDPVNFKDPWGLEGQGAGAAVTSEVPINPAEPQVFPELRFEVERCNAQCRRNNAVTTAVAIASRSRRPEPPLEQPEEPGGPSPDAAPGGGAGGPGPGGGFVDGVGSSLFDRFMLNIRDVLTGGPMNPFRAADALKNLLEDPASIIPGVGEGRLAGALVRDCPADSASCGKAVVDAVEAIVVAIAVGKALGGPKSCSGGKCTGPSCFTAGTLVRTSRGLIPIASIVVGDVVLARHETTGEWGWFPVVQTFVRPTEQLVTIEVEGADSQPDLFETTPEHPFFVDGRGWVEAGGVSVGDRLEGAEGTLTVVDVRLVDEDAQVFNLEVEAAHTYFVGELSALVHNGECPGAGRVIDETKNGQGNIGSAETLPAGQALKTGADWVGPGYKEVGGNGTGVFRSADGTRQFRIDNGSISGSHGSIGPHVHLETVNPNRSGRAAITVNNHVPFTE